MARDYQPGQFVTRRPRYDAARAEAYQNVSSPHRKRLRFIQRWFYRFIVLSAIAITLANLLFAQHYSNIEKQWIIWGTAGIVVSVVIYFRIPKPPFAFLGNLKDKAFQTGFDILIPFTTLVIYVAARWAAPTATSGLFAIMWPVFLIPVLRWSDTFRRVGAKFFLALFVIFCILTILLDIRNVEHNDLAGVVDILTPRLWLLMIAIIILYLTGNLRYHVAREKAVRNVLLSLTSLGANAQLTLAEVAKEIKDWLQTDILFVLRPTSGDVLEITESHSLSETERMSLVKVPLWPQDERYGFTITNADGSSTTYGGTSAYAYINRKSVLADLTLQDRAKRRLLIPDYSHRDTAPVSEMVVPFGCNDARHSGVLGVHSGVEAPFGPEDLIALEAIGEALGISQQYARIGVLFDETVRLMKDAESVVSLNTLINLVGNCARNLLDVDMVTYFSTASGTGHPMYPLRFAGQPLDEKGLLQKQELQGLAKGVVRPLAQKWEPYFQEDVEQDPRLVNRPERRGIGLPFVRREEIRSMCFIPIGTHASRAGCLFLNWRKARQFRSIDKLEIMAFAHAITPKVIELRHMLYLTSGFGQKMIRQHQVADDSNLSKGGIDLEFERLSNNLDETHQRILSDLHREIKRLLWSTRLVSTDFSPLKAKPFDAAISELAITMGGFSLGLIINRQLGELMSACSTEFQEIAYRFIEEACYNAVRHAHARNVDVRFEVMKGKYQLSIGDDGTAFDPQRYEEATTNTFKKTGMFAMLRLARNEMGASWAWDLDSQPGEKWLRISFPLLSE